MVLLHFFTIRVTPKNEKEYSEKKNKQQHKEKEWVEKGLGMFDKVGSGCYMKISPALV